MGVGFEVGSEGVRVQAGTSQRQMREEMEGGRAVDVWREKLGWLRREVRESRLEWGSGEAKGVRRIGESRYVGEEGGLLGVEQVAWRGLLLGFSVADRWCRLMCNT